MTGSCDGKWTWSLLQLNHAIVFTEFGIKLIRVTVRGTLFLFEYIFFGRTNLRIRRMRPTMATTFPLPRLLISVTSRGCKTIPVTIAVMEETVAIGKGMSYMKRKRTIVFVSQQAWALQNGRKSSCV